MKICIFEIFEVIIISLIHHIVTYIFHNLSIFLVLLVQYNFNLSELSTTFNCLKHIHSQIKEIAKDTNLHLNPVAQTFFKLVV